MKCHILFSEKNKKNISKCRLLKILPRVLSVKRDVGTQADGNTHPQMSLKSDTLTLKYQENLHLKM